LISGAYKIPRKLKLVIKNVLSFASSFDKDIKKTVSRKTKNYFPTYDFVRNVREYNVITFVQEIMHNSIKAMLFIFENMTKFNEKKILRSIGKPVLILSGDKDSIINISNSKKLHKLIKNSQLKIFPLGNHEIITTIPKEVSEEILSFI